MLNLINRIFVPIFKRTVSGVTEAAILAMGGLVAFLFNSTEGNGDDYTGDLVGDERRAIQPGRLYQFDGTNDYVDISSALPSTDLMGTAGISVSCWAKRTGNAGAANMLFSHRDQSTELIQLALHSVNGTTVQFRSSTGTLYSIQYTGGTDTDWNHYAAIFDFTGDELKLYINGVEVDQVAIVSTGTLDSAATYAGAFTSGGAPSGYMHGCMNSLCIANVVWSDAEIVALYGHTLPSTDYLGFYKMDEAAGTTAYDSSGNANHGTITNATLSTFHATDTGVTFSYANEYGYSDYDFFNGSSSYINTNVTQPSVTGYITGKFQSIETGSNGQILSNRLSSSNYFIISTSEADGHLMQFRVKDGATTVNLNSSTGGLSFDTDPHSFKCVFDGSKCELWVDDVLVDSSTSLTSIPSNVNNLFIGQRGNGAGFFGGITFDLKWYSTGDVLLDSWDGRGTDKWNGGTPFDTESLYAPRDESDTANDVTGSALDYTGRVKYDFNFVNSNCLTFDGSNDYVDCGNLGSVTSVSFWIQSIVDDQEIMTLDGANSGRIYVTGGVLSFGGSLSSSAITVDGVSKTASEAGALINDNDWHLVVATVPSFTADNVRLGRNASTYGNIRLANVQFNSGALGHYPLAEGSSSAAYDVSGNDNHGTMTNFTLADAWGTTQNVYHYNIKNGFTFALDMDGVDDYIALGTEIALGTDDFSFGGWFCLDALGSNQGFFGTDGSNRVILNASNKFVIRLGGSNYASSWSMVANEWVHIACSFSRAGNAILYVNGAFEENIDISAGSASSISTETLGVDTVAAANFWNGKLHGVFFTESILTGTDMSDIYGGDVSAAKYYYPLSEGQGTTINDLGDNANNGTLTNADLAVSWGYRIPANNSGQDVFNLDVSNPSGAWHNNAETELNAPNAPAMHVANDAEGNDFLFNSSDVVEDITYALIDDNINDSGYFFADISTDNEKKNLLIFDEEKTGSDLADIQTFLNH